VTELAVSRTPIAGPDTFVGGMAWNKSDSRPASAAPPELAVSRTPIAGPDTFVGGMAWNKSDSRPASASEEETGR
jgi:hypothetical protein